MISDKHIRDQFKYYQIKTHVQTACESHYLNIDFRSCDNGFKQLSIMNFMQEYCLIFANSADSDEMQNHAAFYLGIHWSSKYPFRGFQYMRG